MQGFQENKSSDVVCLHPCIHNPRQFTVMATLIFQSFNTLLAELDTVTMFKESKEGPPYESREEAIRDSLQYKLEF